MYEELIKRLKDRAERFDYDGWVDTAIVLEQAADAIEELEYALLLMVLQYCTTDDGLLFHEFMTAGENAFAVLGLKNGQQEAPLWFKMNKTMQSAIERISAKTAPKENKEDV